MTSEQVYEIIREALLRGDDICYECGEGCDEAFKMCCELIEILRKCL